MFLMKKLVQAGFLASPVAGYVYGVKSAEEAYHTHTDVTEESKKGVVGLYTLNGSPYAAKVLAYLDYNGVAYNQTSISMVTKKELIFSRDYKLTPIAMIKGVQVNDSTDIIKTLAEEKKGFFSSGFSSKDEKAMKIVDEKVAPATIMTMLGSAEAASAVGGKFNPVLKMLLPLYAPIGRYMVTNKYGEAADTDMLIPALEEAFSVIGNNRNATPAELALFGVIKNIDVIPDTMVALDHCGRRAWFNNLNAKCEQNSKKITEV